MLTINSDAAAVGEMTAANETTPATGKNRLAKMMQLEWLGQTIASLCWIVSVFAYGISQTGDVLQLCAASAWLLANIASVAKTEVD